MTFTALMEEEFARRDRSAAQHPHAAYYAALKLVAGIEQNLASGCRHYRTKNGKLLTTLDEVVNAIVNHQLEGMA